MTLSFSAYFRRTRLNIYINRRTVFGYYHHLKSTDFRVLLLLLLINNIEFIACTNIPGFFFFFVPQTSHDGRTRSSTADGHENDAVHDGRPGRRRATGRAAGPAGLVAGRHVAGRRRARRRGRVRGGRATAARTLFPVAAPGRLAHVLDEISCIF